LAAGLEVIVNAFVSVAATQLPLLTVNVKVTVVPASPTAGIYVGVKVVAPEIVPPPLWVHSIVPFVELAPDTVKAVV
jgi:hypothetical protein